MREKRGLFAPTGHPSGSPLAPDLLTSRTIAHSTIKHGKREESRAILEGLRESLERERKPGEREPGEREPGEREPGEPERELGERA